VFLSLEVARIEPETILEAIDLHRLHHFALWDCLILECAVATGCSKLYTEDLTHGQTIRGVEIVDPFAGGG